LREIHPDKKDPKSYPNIGAVAGELIKLGKYLTSCALTWKKSIKTRICTLITILVHVRLRYNSQSIG
jgi:hypothetical protein